MNHHLGYPTICEDTLEFNKAVYLALAVLPDGTSARHGAMPGIG